MLQSVILNLMLNSYVTELIRILFVIQINILIDTLYRLLMHAL